MLMMRGRAGGQGCASSGDSGASVGSISGSREGGGGGVLLWELPMPLPATLGGAARPWA